MLKQHYSLLPRLILTYLIPCRLITKHNIPSAALLTAFPHLQNIFGPLVTCIKSGDLAGFDNALLASEPEFVKRRVYLTLERGRDIALRNLLRRVFLAAGFEDPTEGQAATDRIRKTRLPIAHFAAALRMGTRGEGSGQDLDDDEVECLLANMIYKVRGSLQRLSFVTTCNPNPYTTIIAAILFAFSCGGLPSVASFEANASHSSSTVP